MEWMRILRAQAGRFRQRLARRGARLATYEVSYGQLCIFIVVAAGAVVLIVALFR